MGDPKPPLECSLTVAIFGFMSEVIEPISMKGFIITKGTGGRIKKGFSSVGMGE